MKRALILAIVLLIGAAFTVSAQDISVEAGGKAGLNFGWFSGDDWDPDDNGIGIGLTLADQ